MQCPRAYQHIPTMAVDQDPIDFILAQVKDNIKYLQSKGRVSESAANQINDLLVQQPPVTSRAVSTPVVATPVRTPTFSPPPSAPFRAPPPPQQQPQVQRVRALYDYNVSIFKRRSTAKLSWHQDMQTDLSAPSFYRGLTSARFLET